jgi:hypothetical protein
MRCFDATGVLHGRMLDYFGGAHAHPRLLSDSFTERPSAARSLPRTDSPIFSASHAACESESPLRTAHLLFEGPLHLGGHPRPQVPRGVSWGEAGAGAPRAAAGSQARQHIEERHDAQGGPLPHHQRLQHSSRG